MEQFIIAAGTTAASRITESTGGNLVQIEAKSPAPSTHENGHPHKA